MINGYIIRAYMREAGVTVKDIANSLSVSKPFVSQVVHNVKRNQRVREAIAEAVNRPVNDLWPDEQNTLSSAAQMRSVGPDCFVAEDGCFLQGKIDG